MDYRVVFDINRSWPSLWFPLLGILIGASAAFALKHRGRFPWVRKGKRTEDPVVLVGVLLVSMLITVVTGGISLYRYYEARVAFRDGNYRVVKGRVENFQPMPWAGHAMERFEVEGVPFEYSDYLLTPGFNNTSSHGGPIREGLPVRITYLPTAPDKTIVKLEVGK